MVREMEKPGELVHIVNGDLLDFMRSGRTELWTNVLVAFENHPTPGMEHAAPALYWMVQTEDGTFEVWLPKVCNNLAGRWTRRVEARLECAYVLFEARADDAYAVVHVLGAPVPEPDHCQISRSSSIGRNGANFDGVSFVDLVDGVPSRCPTDVIPGFYGLPNLQVGSFQVSPGWWAVKVPVALADNPRNRVVVCIVKKNGLATHAMGVQHFDYNLMEGTGRKFAVIWYSEAEVQQNYRGRTNLWRRWSQQIDGCRSSAGNWFY